MQITQVGTIQYSYITKIINNDTITHRYFPWSSKYGSNKITVEEGRQIGNFKL